MSEKIQALIAKVTSGGFTRSQIENLRKNAQSRDGTEELIRVCDDALSPGPGTPRRNPNTREIGILETIQEIKRRGGSQVEVIAEGNKKIIQFISPDTKRYRVIPRSKKTGDWQTSIAYGERQDENPLETVFWIFIDIGYSPPKYYISPLWWIKNDIYLTHQSYLKRNGGHRSRNDNSSHHAIGLDRVKRWEARWDFIGLA